MKKILMMSVGLAAVSVIVKAQNGPTMGWSSWNAFGVNISDATIRRQADAVVSTGLKDVGFNHVNIDDGYFGGRNNETGDLIIHPQRFPNGLKPVADYIHSKGLKAGIYSDAGANSCGNFWSNDVLSENVGFYGHDQHDADFFFKECGFDFIKIDFCGGDGPQNKQNLVLDPQERYTAIRDAIRNTGRTDVRMNICRWEYPGTWVGDVGFSWRTTRDINDAWWSVRGILAENIYLSAYSSEGHYNDMDMLEVGRSMTTEEDRTHFGMWCIMNSPLLIGCDLTTISRSALNLLKNQELIALNQDPTYQQAYIVDKQNGCHVLVRDLETIEGNTRAFAVYNPNDDERRVTVKMKDICLGGNVELRELITRQDLSPVTDQLEVTLPAHGTRIYRAKGDVRTERTRYEAETAFITKYQELKNNQTEETGIYIAADNCSGGFKAGWLGNSDQNDLIWRNVYSKAGGKYRLTVGFISGDNRNITVNVNGNAVQTISVNSGSWDAVATKSIEVDLQPGRNTVRLSNAANWMPDIDYIDMELIESGIDPTSIEPVFRTTSQQAYDINGLQATSASAIHIQKDKKYTARHLHH